jgi:hypothetical protein
MNEKVAEQNANEKKLRRELERTKREYDRKGIKRKGRRSKKKGKSM